MAFPLTLPVSKKEGEKGRSFKIPIQKVKTHQNVTYLDHPLIPKEFKGRIVEKIETQTHIFSYPISPSFIQNDEGVTMVFAIGALYDPGQDPSKMPLLCFNNNHISFFKKWTDKGIFPPEGMLGEEKIIFDPRINFAPHSTKKD